MVKRFLAGFFDIFFLMSISTLLIYLKQVYKLNDFILQLFFATPILLFYLGYIPFKYNKRTIMEKIFNIEARVKIPEHLEYDKKNKLIQFFILFEERFILLLFDIIGINLIKAIFTKFKKKEN